MTLPQVERNVVLIVDDDEANCFLLKVVLESETAAVPICASNIQEAIQIAQDCKPNLFVIDYHLGLVNGIALCHRLRSLPGLEKTPAVFMSALPITTLKEVALISDATLIEKPFELDALLNVIQSHLHI